MRALITIIFIFITRTASQVCDKTNNTVELTNLSYNGKIYNKGEYYIDDVTGIAFGCVCLKEICGRKCCPLGEAYVSSLKICVKASPAALGVWEASPMTSKFRGTEGAHFVIGKMNCTRLLNESRIPALPAADSMEMKSDGRLYVEIPNNNPPSYLYGHDKYCIDTFYQHENDTNPKINALICFTAGSQEPANHYSMSSSCMLISCFFILLTVAVYAWLPELRNLHGMVLIAYLLSFFVGFLALATMQIMIMNDDVPPTMCVSLTFIIYYSLLAAFFWLNVMCYDIWWTFSGTRGMSNRGSTRARFLYYCAYAFGMPTALTILLAALEYSDLPKPNPLLPNMTMYGCFLYGYSKLLYLYTPILILCIANLIFFTLTAIKIVAIRKLTTDMQKNQKDQQRFGLYIKLFAVMGINWVLEVASALYPKMDYIWQFTDAYNVLLGLIIFIIFVCKRKTLLMIKKRYRQLRGLPTGTTATPSSRTFSTQSRDEISLTSVQK